MIFFILINFVVQYKLVFAKRAVTCKLPKRRCVSIEDIIRTIEVIYMLLVIIDYVKSLIDWYVDYRIDQKEKEKNHRRSRKNER